MEQARMPGGQDENAPILLDLLIQRFGWMEKQLNIRLMDEVGFRMSRGQIQFMSYLEDGQGRASSMSQKLGISRQAVSQIVKELEARGIIVQAPDPEKGSAKLLKATPYGRKFAGKAIGILMTIEREIEQSIGKKEFAALQRALAAEWK